MRTKNDVQIQLLKEIDEICSDNNLHYVLTGINSLNAFRNNTIRDGYRITAVAMTQGDIDRFREIIERDYSENRYIEGMFNNSKYNVYHFSYGDKNTTDFHVTNWNKHKHHGINILIYPIRKVDTIDGKPVKTWKSKIIAKDRKTRNFLNKRVESKRFWYIKDGLIILDAFYSLTGGGKRYYYMLKKNTFIDKWEDIQNYPLVHIGNKNLSSEFFKDVERYEVDGLKLCFPMDIRNYYETIYGEDYETRTLPSKPQRIRDIVDTEFGYEEILDETMDILKEARSIHEEIKVKRNDVKEEKRAVKNVWRLVKMTNRQLVYTKFFEENFDKLNSLDLDNPEEFEELNEQLKKVIYTLKSYSKYGMTFSINPEVDELIEKVLIKNGEEELVEKLKVISEKEFFVE
jgi:phosphorylcholine metabolism protein LicD